MFTNIQMKETNEITNNNLKNNNNSQYIKQITNILNTILKQNNINNTQTLKTCTV